VSPSVDLVAAKFDDVFVAFARRSTGRFDLLDKPLHAISGVDLAAGPVPNGSSKSRVMSEAVQVILIGVPQCHGEDTFAQ